MNEELSEAVAVLQFETDFQASEYAAEDHDCPEVLQSINARITVLQYLKKMELVCEIARELQEEKLGAMRERLRSAGWSEKCGQWSSPKFMDGKSSLSLATAHMLLLDYALDDVNGG